MVEENNRREKNMEMRCCMDCACWMPLGEARKDASKGECHRRAPIATKGEEETDYSPYLVHWPTTESCDECPEGFAIKEGG